MEPGHCYRYVYTYVLLIYVELYSCQQSSIPNKVSELVGHFCHTYTYLHNYRLDAESNGSAQCRNPRGPRLSASRAK